jgi:hypothetical protein
MGSSLQQLTSRQLERLKSELAEVIIANFCYPAFLDYRLNMLRTRPVDRRKRQEVWAYINSVNFKSLDTMDVASMDFRRFVERVFLRYIDMNRTLLARASPRQLAAVRARVPQLAAGVGRGLADYLALGEASAFGRARVVESWGATREGSREISWEQIEKSTQLLQTTLVYLRSSGVDKAAPAAVGGGAHLADAALASISDFPTRLLSQVDAGQRLASAGATNGASVASYYAPSGQAAANGSQPGEQDQAWIASLPAERQPAPQNLFQGPSRLPSISRPVDRAPSTTASGASGDASIERKEPPAPPIQSSPVPQPTAGSRPEEDPDAWQPLLPRGDAGQPPARASEVGAWSALADQPFLELPELPEAFDTPRLLDLPPDLAELYGDYLRDARAGSVDLAPSDTHEPQAAEAQPAPPVAFLPQSETDDEIDAIFTALSNHIAAHEVARQESAPQHAGAPAPGDTRPSGPVPHKPDSLGAAQEASTASEASGPLMAQRSGSGSLAASAPAPQAASPQQQVAASPDASRAAALPASRPPERDPGAEEQRPAAGAKGMTDGDVMIFSQLQHQISIWVKMAAVSHQIDLAGRDAAALVAELRRTAALEEAELQVIESLVALCQRVTSTKQATMDDYKQAMMLYLLHHRSRLAL